MPLNQAFPKQVTAATRQAVEHMLPADILATTLKTSSMKAPSPKCTIRPGAAAAVN